MVAPSPEIRAPATAAPVPEARRLDLLARSGLLDTRPEDSFQALAACAARFSGFPYARLHLVTADRLWPKASHGLPLSPLPRSGTPCDCIVREALPLEVPDLCHDGRFEGLAILVDADGDGDGDGHRVQAYAGLPLCVEGAVLGTLAVFDRQPRQLDAAARASLGQLAQAAAELIALRLRMRDGEQQRSRLLDFARASGDWMWELDAALRYQWISDAFEAATGVPAGRWIGQRIDDAPLLDEAGFALPEGGNLHDLLRRPEPFSRAISRQRLGDGERFLSRSAVPLLDAAGRLQGWRGTSRDLTPRMRITALAMEREQRLVKLSQQVPGVLFQYRTDAQGRSTYAYASDRAREVFGAEASPVDDALLPRRLLHPDDRAAFDASLAASARSLQPWVHEYRLRGEDGRLRWIETRATPERLPDGGTQWHGFGADITQRKQIELHLRDSEQRWELAAEATGIGVASLDLASQTMSFDRRGCANHGLPYPHPPTPLHDYFEAMHEADRTTVRAGLQRALAGPGIFESRYRLLRPDGEWRLIEIVARCVRGPDDEPRSLAGTCRDVTEQAASERLRLDKEAAERANQAKTEFLSRVSHELRTPLNGILGFTQLMALDTLEALSPAQRQRLERVQGAGQHLLALINDMLDLTRIEHGGSHAATMPVDLAPVLARALALIQPLAAPRKVRLPPAPEGACWVQADARLLEQVLMNLLSNAIKYNRPAGAVDVAVRREGVRATVEVRDEGPGLSPAQQGSLFQPFNRLGAEQRRIEGSGLGLVIARELARSMGGELSLRSSSPQGSVFALSLPLSDSPPLDLPEPDPVATDAASTGPRTLLYIEDEALNVVLMEELVRTRPEWTLHVTRDGASGLAAARALHPDLVLIDMNLPDATGLSLIRALRGDPLTAGLRCIVLSADAMREQIETARAAGFDDYWTKPIDVLSMLGALSRVLSAPPPAR